MATARRSLLFSGSAVSRCSVPLITPGNVGRGLVPRNDLGGGQAPALHGINTIDQCCNEAPGFGLLTTRPVTPAPQVRACHRPLVGTTLQIEPIRAAAKLHPPDATKLAADGLVARSPQPVARCSENNGEVMLNRDRPCSRPRRPLAPCRSFPPEFLMMSEITDL